MIDVLRLDELEGLARERLDRMRFDYIAGGADDEWTLRENQAAFRRWQIVSRVLVDLRAHDLATTVLGTAVSMPIMVAPTGFQGLVHAEGEVAMARGVAAAHTIMTASTASNRSLEEIAAAAPDATRWFQLYVYRDRGMTQSLVERAVAAGYKALCVTVDTPLVGRRERDMRNSFTLPPGLRLANFADTPADDLPEETRQSGLAAYVAAQWDNSLTWKDIDWLAGISPLPLVLKGILAPADAVLAVEHGAQAVIVSNHGGRQLDGVPATISVLPQVVAAVGGRCEVLLDGGIRRGTDVLKAVALGARAVLLGRPAVWGLCLDGSAGVTQVLTMLREELSLAMSLSGCPTVADLSPAVLWRE